MDKVKLVIWDLDETFWKGTLSDGAVTPIRENIELVRELTDKGIVNSICSKNDFEQAKKVLVDMGIWDLFVFPSIDWNPKGARVQSIIQSMNLRPVNTLFVDDNVNNLEEAKFITPSLQTTLPQDLNKIVDSEAFEGKDDNNHSRLEQYKLLERKAEAAKTCASNEEFLYKSDIVVELDGDCSSYLERIYEMIHRNNQLNYTKDRISQSEVNELFTDKSIVSGVVKVHDRYGDHGIIGCYAVKEGKAVQFVFSCRILGMGVEQYVYAKLGYPELEVVGEVATELNKENCPGWINQNTISSKVSRRDKQVAGRLILYGTCPLRPVWSYLEPQLRDAVFAEIDPAPSICNLSVLLHEKKTQIDEWIKKINIFDSRYSFDSEIVNGETRYLLITLDREWNSLKYTSEDGRYFYSQVELNEHNCEKEILDSYRCSKVSVNEIENVLRDVLSHVQNLTIFIMTLPEVVFPSIGKDENYMIRVRLNEMVERLEAAYDNLKLVEIRNYAKDPSDFFDLASNHYNRSIGYALAQDVLRLMGDCNYNSGTTSEKPYNSNSVHEKIRISTDVDVLVESSIVNGKMTVRVDVDDSAKWFFLYDFVRDSYLEQRTDWGASRYETCRIDKYGTWQVVVHLKNRASEETYVCKSGLLDYRDFNILNFIDPSKDDFEDYIRGTNQLHNDFCKSSKFINYVHNMIAELAADGVNFLDYFIERGIHEMSIFSDDRNIEMVIPFVRKRNLSINKIYLVGDDIKRVKEKYSEYNIVTLSKKSVDDLRKDHVLWAYDGYQNLLFRGLFIEKKCVIHSLYFVLNCMKTQIQVRRLMKECNIKQAYVVRTGNLGKLNGMPYTYVKSGEKKLEKESLGKILKKEGFECPAFMVPKTEYKNGVMVFGDVNSPEINVIDGYRVTTNNPENYKGKIFVYGNQTVFGYGVRDYETIPSYIQGLMPEYKVINCANCWKTEDYPETFRLIEKTYFDDNDIVILVISHWMPEKRTEVVGRRPNWVEYDGMEKTGFVPIDCFPVFAEPSREDFFTSKYNYNAVGNRKIAEWICKSIKTTT